MSKFDATKDEQFTAVTPAGTEVEGIIKRVDPGGLGLNVTFIVLATDKKGRKLPQWKFDSKAEAHTALSNTLRSFRIVEQGEKQADAEDRKIVQAAVDEAVASGAKLPANIAAKAHALGIVPTAAAAPPSDGGDGPFTREDQDVYNCWSAENEYFDQKHAARVKRNHDAIVAWLNAHTEARPLTRAILDQAFKTLWSMGCIQQNSTIHQRSGPAHGGKSYEYRAGNDKTLTATTKKVLTESEVAACNTKFVMSGIPQGTPISAETAERVLGPELAAAWCEAVSVGSKK